jgi:RecA-family ATPase
MASGRDLLAIGGTRPSLRVWYWNLEDPRDELTRRIQATAMHFDLDIADIDGRLFVDTGREQELVIAESTRAGAKIIRPVVDSLIEELKAKSIDVLSVDPFVSCHHVTENDNNAIDRVAKEWGAVELVHHTRKPSNGETEATTDSARGAKAPAALSSRSIE